MLYLRFIISLVICCCFFFVSAQAKGIGNTGGLSSTGMKKLEQGLDNIAKTAKDDSIKNLSPKK